MAKVGSRQDHHERLNFKLSRLTWIAKILATNFRRDKQKGLTVNRVNVTINHQKRLFAKQSRSELSASTLLSERFDLKLSHLTWVAKILKL